MHKPQSEPIIVSDGKRKIKIMMNVYTLFAMDEEPGSRVIGEFGHDIIGVYDCMIEAIKVAETYKCNHEALLITVTTLGGTSFNSKELWRWSFSADN